MTPVGFAKPLLKELEAVSRLLCRITFRVPCFHQALPRPWTSSPSGNSLRSSQE
ncbi:hypothetical protein EXN66_Car003448 [Channa argus]|uniref:Uncharacterized protein n=1 Tax=Channa argus TaxID=215402 RepID=A0A6G1PCM1_CHAAH|nr:hypothetical protein EXN66_Car003448 [Channa argus]